MRNIKTTKYNPSSNKYRALKCEKELAQILDPPKPVKNKPSNMFEWFEEQMAFPASKDEDTNASRKKHEECISENKIYYDEILGLASYLRDRKGKEKEISRAVRIVDNKPIESYLSIVPSKKEKGSFDTGISTQNLRTILLTLNLLMERSDYAKSEVLLTDAIKKHPYSSRLIHKYLELCYIQGDRDMFNEITKQKQTLFSNGVVPTWETFEFTTIKTTKPPEVHSQKKRSITPSKKTTYKTTYTELKTQREHVNWRQNKMAASN